MTYTVHTTALHSLPLLARGKVRDNYAVGTDRILMVASDRLSAFDVIVGEPIPGKGWVIMMRDTTGERAERLQFLGLSQLFLRRGECRVPLDDRVGHRVESAC